METNIAQITSAAMTQITRFISQTPSHNGRVQLASYQNVKPAEATFSGMAEQIGQGRAPWTQGSWPDQIAIGSFAPFEQQRTTLIGGLAKSAPVLQS
jgi:hypothetical protein